MSEVVSRKEPTTRKDESECPVQMVCEDCILDDQKKVCVLFQDDECWAQAYEDESDGYDSYEEGYDF
jgi:hypothetical protein